MSDLTLCCTSTFKHDRLFSEFNVPYEVTEEEEQKQKQADQRNSDENAKIEQRRRDAQEHGVQTQNCYSARLMSAF
jgi:hypothetical protein